jgi:hypothetical protein
VFIYEVGHGMKVVWVGVEWMMMHVGWIRGCSGMVGKHVSWFLYKRW